MTRPKADSDPWITDPIARDRVVAKTVVEGIRTIIGLLRTMRDEAAVTRALQDENRELRQQVMELYEWKTTMTTPPPPQQRSRARFNRCENEMCSLPQGHLGNHRGYMRPQA